MISKERIENLSNNDVCDEGGGAKGNLGFIIFNSNFLWVKFRNINIFTLDTLLNLFQGRGHPKKFTWVFRFESIIEIILEIV